VIGDRPLIIDITSVDQADDRGCALLQLWHKRLRSSAAPMDDGTLTLAPPAAKTNPPSCSTISKSDSSSNHRRLMYFVCGATDENRRIARVYEEFNSFPEYYPTEAEIEGAIESRPIHKSIIRESSGAPTHSQRSTGAHSCCRRLSRSHSAPPMGPNLHRYFRRRLS
jgi:hypothetical protein